MATGTQLEKSPPVMPGKVQSGGRLQGLFGLVRVRWSQMAGAQRGWVAVSALMVVALIGGLTWYALSPDWRTLYVNLDPDDARQIGQTLAAAQISFEPSPDGAGILVPAAQLDKARLATAAKGGVKSGRLGFEIFDKPNWVGSEFDEQVNYQRALEGELEHTVGTLSDVQSARVHLVLPHDSLFQGEERPAKASVVLKLRRSSLADGEPEAIRNLVASAVDGLTPDHVVLVDASGHLPLGPKTPEAMQLSAEQALEDKLVSTLEPVTGTGNVRASVTLAYDDTSTDETAEIYDPDKTATLAMQRTDQTTGAQPVAAGVPGAASNAPNTQALPVYPRESAPPQTAKSESSTYGVSKTVRHTVENPGRVRRLTAAIVVNDRLITPGTKNHAAVWQPRSADELRNLTALAQAAVGFDTTRGDVVTVQDLAFDGNQGQPSAGVPEQMLSSAENSPVLVKYIALLLGLFVVVAFAVRPAIRHAGTALATRGPSKTAARELAATTTPALSSAEPAPVDPERLRNQEIYEQVTGHMKREPTQSSRLLQSWIHSE
ncbi:MAG TPA: flagellar basal-body MS-ring/collar protein FliF [Terracidiphilus sp.]